MTTEAISPASGSLKLLEKLKTMEIDVQSCYQCGRCSAGCPFSVFFDLNVMEVVRLASYGAEERLLTSKTIWLCGACETCSSRCPNDIEIAHLMDVLRELALRKGIQPAEKRVAIFHDCFLGSIKHWGRAYEVGMIGAYKLRSRDLLGDMKLGLNMFQKGRLSLRPHGISAKTEITEIFSGKGKEYER